MNTSLSDLKLNLIHYFTKINNYSALKDFEDDNNVFLVSQKNRSGYKIIRIISGDINAPNTNVDIVKNIVKANKREKIIVLNLVLVPNSSLFTSSQDNIYLSSFEDARFKLVYYFQDIKNYVFFTEEKSSQSKIEEKNIYVGQEKQITKNGQDKLREEFINFSKKLQVNTVTSKIFSVWFCFIPTALLALFYYGKSQGFFPMVTDLSTADVFFTATNRTIFLKAGQYWRIFTYGMSVFNTGYSKGGNIIYAIIDLIIVWIFLPILVKLVTGVSSKNKFLLTFFTSYIFLGLFFSLVFTEYVFSGVFIVMSIIIGQAFVVSIHTEKSVAKTLLKRKLITPTILIILISLFAGDYQDIIGIMSGISVGAAMCHLMNYNYEDLNYMIIPSLLTVILFLATIIASFFFIKYSPPKSQYLIYGLSQYAMLKFYSVSQLNDIYSNIGWNVKLMSSTGNNPIYWFVVSY
ncbi:hypothetical protein [Spiroplasma endosymbiont of Aspidapion aeneum]|uniref:hypothetical protein n=1 Tax=Spiroplasma endosymbiont of Aspidapion aeneum TaxID=3066276 RepID=UPI00313BFE97